MLESGRWTTRGRGGEATTTALSVLLCLAAHLPLSGCQQLCPGTKTQHCNACPDQCPSADQCISQTANVNRCRGSSWANTNSTYMEVSCNPPPGIVDIFPFPSISTATTSPTALSLYKKDDLVAAPLDCNGTVLRGKWPFDADNMSFAIDTFFRDPVRTDLTINTLFLDCVTLTLSVESAIYSGETGGAEGLTCGISKDSLKSFSYSGLEASVCINTDLSQDPMCRKGIWKPISSGTCVSEKVSGQIAMADTGGRTLVRIGGDNMLTGCQPKWTLKVERDGGICSGTKPGFGSCCTTSCFNSEPLSNASCVCNCKPGFVGSRCDRTAPHLSLSLLIFNKTTTDWFASSAADIGKGQPANQYALQSGIAQMLGIPSMYVEFANAVPASNDGTGSGGLLGLYADKPQTTRKSRQLLDVRPGCTRLLESDTNGAGLSRVTVRILTVFEHDLRLLANQVETGLRNGTLESNLDDLGVQLCIMDLGTKFYNAFGFELRSRLPVTPTDALGTEGILLIVFFLLAGLVVAGFFALQVISNRLILNELKRSQTQHKPSELLQRRPLAWRFIHPTSDYDVNYPSSISKQLEKAYLEGWLNNKVHQSRFFYKDHWWTVDFAAMTATEEQKASSGRIKKVISATSFELDNNSSKVMGYYNNKLFSISHNPDGAAVDQSIADQEVVVTNYIGILHEITVEIAIMPSPVPGCYWKVSPGAGSNVVVLIPPGIDKHWFSEFYREDAPDASQWKVHQDFLKRSHAEATSRFAAEIHYPFKQPQPHNTVQNVFRISEIRAEQQADLEAQKVRRRNRASDFGSTSDSGVTTFTGEQLRAWQLSRYDKFVEEDELQRKVHDAAVANEEAFTPLALLGNNHGGLADEVFRREVFDPGSQNLVLAEIGALLPEDDTKGEKDKKMSFLKKAASVRIGHVASIRKNADAQETRIDIASAQPVNVRARAKKKSSMMKRQDDEYTEEVAV